jgi:DNA-binding NtrC family response regulator
VTDTTRDGATQLWGDAAQARVDALGHFRLEVLEPPAARRVVELASARCSIGSHATNDLVVDDATVSRFHCELELGGGAATVRDLASRNGTVVDGVRVLSAFLRVGSVLALGRAQIRFSPLERWSAMALSERTELVELVGHSNAMRGVFALLERAAASDVTVLLDGETGTGKSGAARALHSLSSRRAAPFLTVDCGALPPDLLESELFGHRKGSFTGATEDRAGVFEAARGGTVFLDEIGELPLELQPKLLRVLEEGEVKRLGTNVYKPVDVRIVTASNRDLREEVNAGRFRPDLFYRVAVVRIPLPPLRKRPEDVEPIATKLLRGFGADPARTPALFAPAFMGRLRAAAWPGNVRELRNHLERCLVFQDAALPLALDLPAEGAPSPDPTRTFDRGVRAGLRRAPRRAPRRQRRARRRGRRGRPRVPLPTASAGAAAAAGSPDAAAHHAAAPRVVGLLLFDRSALLAVFSELSVVAVQRREFLLHAPHGAPRASVESTRAPGSSEGVRQGDVPSARRDGDVLAQYEHQHGPRSGGRRDAPGDGRGVGEVVGLRRQCSRTIVGADRAARAGLLGGGRCRGGVHREGRREPGGG